MINYKKIYCKAYGYYEGEYISSEMSDTEAVHFHHISCRGSGGDPQKKKERIENLIALSYDEHTRYGDKKQYMSYLYRLHKINMQLNNVKFDESYIDAQIEKYSHYNLE